MIPVSNPNTYRQGLSALLSSQRKTFLFTINTNVMAYLTLEEINRLDIVDFLASLGYQPKKIAGRSCWYLSMLPGRLESKPSFKVNRAKNKWIDFGYDAREHSLVDLGVLLFNCTIRELVIQLSGPGASLPPVSQCALPADAEETRKLEVVKTFPIQSEYLIRYLWERRIPILVARKFCREAEYTFDRKKLYYAIAFPSDAGGFNLRNKYHKYSSSPKSPTYFCNGSKDIAVFEGFFDMMTFVGLLNCPDHQLPDLLVLNGVSFFHAFMWLMDTYDTKHLFLDNDATGDTLTQTALARKNGYMDHRSLYRGYRDLNLWACRVGTAQKAQILDNLPIIAGKAP
jgi:hypothetical protein